MQTGGLWKELQTARSGLPATIRASRTGSLDTLQPLPTAFSLVLSRPLFRTPPLFPSVYVPTSAAAATAAVATRGFAIYISGVLIFVPVAATPPIHRFILVCICECFRLTR